MKTRPVLLIILILSCASAILAADSLTVTTAKAKQKEQYRQCQDKYLFYTKEMVRISCLKDHDVEVAKTRASANLMAEKAKEIISDAHLQTLIKEEVAVQAEKAAAWQLREKGVAATNAANERDAAVKAAQEAAAARQRAEQQAEAARQRAEQEAESARQQAALEAAMAAQRSRDKETWGILTEAKYNRLEVEMSIDEVETILGPGKNLGSRTLRIGNSQIDLTDYRWICTKGNGVLDICFDRAGLYKKEVRWN